MAKLHRTWNEQKYRRYLKEGRGQGTLSAYKPWILIHDFPSLGMVSRVLGKTTGRIHHLLSNMELSYFYILDWWTKNSGTDIYFVAVVGLRSVTSLPADVKGMPLLGG